MEKKYYEFIHDIDELKFYFDNVMPELKPYELYFCSISCRNKYLTDEEKEYVQLGRTEMMERKVIREKSWQRFLRTIRKYEMAYGSLTSNVGHIIPQKALVIYININPSDTRKAYKEFNQIMTDYLFEISMNMNNNIAERFTKMERVLENCIQKNRGTKHWMDIDFDCDKSPSIVERMVEVLNTTGAKYYIIDCKSGYHILIRKGSLKCNPLTNIIDPIMDWASENGIKVLEGIVNKNSMIPLPGCYQGGYPVTILNKGD